jgi:hypothetical protein
MMTDEWVRANKFWLVERFIEQNEEAWNEFCQKEFNKEAFV